MAKAAKVISTFLKMDSIIHNTTHTYANKGFLMTVFSVTVLLGEQNKPFPLSDTHVRILPMDCGTFTHLFYMVVVFCRLSEHIMNIISSFPGLYLERQAHGGGCNAHKNTSG